jgi:hypothetical protein
VPSIRVGMLDAPWTAGLPDIDRKMRERYLDVDAIESPLDPTPQFSPDFPLFERLTRCHRASYRDMAHT